MLEILDLQAGYGENRVLRGVCFSLQPGQLAGLLGANGSGKTTLLRAICGIVPHEGKCLLHGAPLDGLSAKKLAQKVSYVPQRSGITIDLTALEVVEMGFHANLGLLRRPSRTMTNTAVQALERVGIDPNVNFLHLSEGQKQLCIMARTMVGSSRLVLLDEPESALDLANRYEIFARLKSWMGSRTVLTALHDPQLALQICDVLVLLKDHTVHSILHPKTDSRETMETALCQIYGELRLYDLDGTLVPVKTPEVRA
ncbi:MAG: ABC transporter ATP-binding protein [Oscillospiraceae bacterium]|nr:ABC transporter ATP-binding protein [Oscillospiraceae bacterium]